MQEIYSSITYEIRPGETVPMRAGRATTLSVHGCHARVWVTRSDDVADYWLAAGEQLILRPGDLLWLGVDNDEPAQVVFTIPARCHERAWHWLTRGLLRGRSARARGSLLV